MKRTLVAVLFAMFSLSSLPVFAAITMGDVMSAMSERPHTPPVFAKTERCFPERSITAHLFTKLTEAGYDFSPAGTTVRKEKYKYVGTGLVLGFNEDYRAIISDVVPKSPAESSGVGSKSFKGFYIVAVDGIPVPPGASLSDVTEMIRGSGKTGTGVTVSVQLSVGSYVSRVYERGLGRKRLTVTKDVTSVCFVKKSR